MKSINFKNSFREYAVNGDESKVIRVKINPDMPEKIQNALSEIERFRVEINEKNITEMGEKLCKIFNDAFGTDICTPAFDGENPFSLVEDGKFLFEAFFDVFMPVFLADLESLKIRPEVKKYLEKS